MAPGNKERVVSKASGALWGGEDVALDDPGEGGQLRPVAGKNNHTPESRRAFLPVKWEQIVQEEFVVGGIVGRFPGIPRRMNAGGATEGGDFQTGVVRDHPSPVKLRGGKCLEGGIFFKGRAGFLDHREIRQATQIVNVQAVAEDGPDFPDFVGIARRDEQ